MAFAILVVAIATERPFGPLLRLLERTSRAPCRGWARSSPCPGIPTPRPVAADGLAKTCDYCGSAANLIVTYSADRRILGVECQRCWSVRTADLRKWSYKRAQEEEGEGSDRLRVRFCRLFPGPG